MKGMAILFLIVSLVSCAAELPKLSTQELASRTKLLEAPTQLTIAGVTISFESEAYLDLMPRSVLPAGEKIDCTKEGWLIVPVHLKVSSPLPTGLVIDGVWVHSNGKWWSGTFNRDERGGLAMIARGCPTDPFKPGDMIDVVIRLQQEQKVEHLRALPNQLGAAY
jgi:hypothetical protein